MRRSNSKSYALALASAIEEMTEPVVRDMILSKSERQLIVEALRATATPVAWRWRLAEQHPWHYAELNPPQLPAGSECQPLYAADLQTVKPKPEPTSIALLSLAEKLENVYSPEDLKEAAAILQRTHDAMALMRKIVWDDGLNGKCSKLAIEAINLITNPHPRQVVQHDDSKIEKLLKEARAEVDAMSAAELDEMLHKQDVGWARSEAQWAKDFREGKTDRD